MVPSVTLTGLLGGLLVLTTTSTNHAASDLNTVQDRTVQDRPAATGQQISAGMIEIDGAKNPEAIPEYLAWTLGLSGLSIIKRNNIVTAIEELGLSPADAALAFAEGERQGKRDQECSSRYEADRGIDARSTRRQDRGGAPSGNTQVPVGGPRCQGQSAEFHDSRGPGGADGVGVGWSQRHQEPRS